MQFYDDTNKSGICQEIDRICDTTDTTYTRLAKTSRVNEAQEELVGDIIAADGTWEYDDTNYTTLPRGTGTLVEGQETYSFAAEYLQITSIEILDTNSVYYKLDPIDQAELNGRSPQEVFGIDSGSPRKGRPLYYDILGDTIFLYPAPAAANVTLASGIRVWFKRKPQAFTAVSTTAADTTEPGLPSPYHKLLAYMASLPHCATYHPERVAWLERKIGSADRTSPVYGGMKKSLIEFYSLRHRDKTKQITSKPISFR